MRPSRAASIILLPVLVLGSPTPQVTDNSQQLEARPGPDWPSLSTLLNRVQPHFLHNVLHQLSPKYQDGIFDEDRAAIASVHASDPVVATKLVHLALKRQNNETVTDTTTTSTTTQAPPTTTTPSPTTTTVAPPTSTTTVPPSSSTTTPSQSTTPPSSSTTPPSSSTTTPPPSSSSTSAAPLDSTQQSSISSQLASQITASSDPPPTTVQVAPETPAGATPVRTVDGGVVYSTIGGGVATATSRNVAVSFTKSSSTRLSTTTRADGSVETLTSVVIVNAPVTAEGADAAGASATSGGPGLQNGAMGGQHGVIVGAWVKWVVALGAVGVGGVAIGL